MSVDELARSMLVQAGQRMKVLPILLQDGACSAGHASYPNRL